MATYAFNAVVAARTRAAAFIESAPELLAQFVERGGLPSDLASVIATGRAAESANQGQSAAGAAGFASTSTVLARFAALQREYKAVMAVVRAARDDLTAGGAPPEVLASVDRILVDETAVHVTTVKAAGGASARKALKNDSQEAVRAEIRKDAGALMEVPAIVRALAARRVDLARLAQLRDAADALGGHLSARIATKAEQKLATAAETAAAKAQRAKWGGIYRILASLPDERVRALLAAASRS